MPFWKFKILQFKWGYQWNLWWFSKLVRLQAQALFLIGWISMNKHSYQHWKIKDYYWKIKVFIPSQNTGWLPLVEHNRGLFRMISEKQHLSNWTIHSIRTHNKLNAYNTKINQILNNNKQFCSSAENTFTFILTRSFYIVHSLTDLSF